MVQLCCKLLSKDAKLPTRSHPFDAGCDLYSAHSCLIPPHGQSHLRTDVSVVIPDGHYGRCASKSGLSANHSIEIGAGVVDQGYTGPIMVIAYNHSDTAYQVEKGDKIAQLILEKISIPKIVEVTDLPMTERGDHGFGSTGRQ